MKLAPVRVFSCKHLPRFQGLAGWREKRQKQIYFKTNKQTNKTWTF